MSKGSKFGAIAASSTIAVAMVASTQLSQAPVAEAYTKTGCHVTSNTRWYLSNPVQDEETRAEDSMINWTNYAGNLVHPVRWPGPQSGSSYIQVVAANYGSVSWDGYSTWTCASNGLSGKVTVEINRYHTANYGWVAEQSVYSHEFGHAFGLGHSGNDSTPCSAAANMLPNTPHRAACNAYYPKSDDSNGIKAIY